MEVRPLSVEERPAAIRLVERLLLELGEEHEDCPAIDVDAVLAGWQAREGSAFEFLAVDGETPVGIITVVESFALYANGPYGIINEMYVEAPHRSSGVGARLVRAVVELGRGRGWSRIDVTAPESERWARTRAFYERQGFDFAGPKLKLAL